MKKSRNSFLFPRLKTDRGIDFRWHDLELREAIARRKSWMEVFVGMGRAVGYSHQKQKTNGGLFAADLISISLESL
jgi:hypothetical protein